MGRLGEEALLAVSLDDKDALAHAILAHMLMWGSEWEGAIAEARAALALNPNSAFVISMLGFGGHRDEALDRLRQAMRQSARSADMAVDSVDRVHSIERAKFRCSACDTAPNCPAASGLGAGSPRLTKDNAERLLRFWQFARPSSRRIVIDPAATR
jgi:hypothetical protein